jgi:hypothetical protein
MDGINRFFKGEGPASQQVAQDIGATHRRPVEGRIDWAKRLVFEELRPPATFGD